MKFDVSPFGTALGGPFFLCAKYMVAGAERSRRLRRLAAWSSIAGSLLTRWGWLRAGAASAAHSSTHAEPRPRELAHPATPRPAPAEEPRRPLRPTGSE